MKRVNPMNDMRISGKSKAIVENVVQVATGAGQLAAVKDRRIRRITSRLMPLLDNVAPDNQVYHFSKGMMGYGGTERTWGHSKEAEYVRRQGGIETIAQKADQALERIPEIEEQVRKETVTFANAVRSKETSKRAGRWSKIVSAARYVAAGVAAVGAGVAAYIGIRNGMQADPETYRLALDAAVAGLGASAVLAVGYKACKAPEAQEETEEATSVQRVLNDLRANLRELARLKPVTEN